VAGVAAKSAAATGIDYGEAASITGTIRLSEMAENICS